MERGGERGDYIPEIWLDNAKWTLNDTLSLHHARSQKLGVLYELALHMFAVMGDTFGEQQGAACGVIPLGGQWYPRQKPYSCHYPSVVTLEG